MHQQWVVLRVEDSLQDSAHNRLWDIRLLGTLHGNANMVDAARMHETLVTFWILLVHQSTGLD